MGILGEAKQNCAFLYSLTHTQTHTHTHTQIYIHIYTIMARKIDALWFLEDNCIRQQKWIQNG